MMKFLFYIAKLDVKPSLYVSLVQEFSSDMGSRGVKRIADVGRLRTAQFSQVFYSISLTQDYVFLLLMVTCSFSN